ncbi:MAG: DUF551 domain-containing protein [Variibacter sp.]
MSRGAAPRSGKSVQPSDAEIVAAARALWRFDLCGLLLENGEHVLCDDERLAPRLRHSRCLCREKSRALLTAAAAKRPKPPVDKVIIEKPAPDKVADAPAAEKPVASPSAAAPHFEAPALQQAPSVVPAPAGDAVRDATHWHPIATVPPPPPDGEGKRVLYLLFDPAVGVTPGYWVADPWGGGDWFATSAALDKLNPSHWMPLPDPP